MVKYAYDMHGLSNNALISHHWLAASQFSGANKQGPEPTTGRRQSQTKKNIVFLRYINHIKSYFFAELNENNFYMKIIDLDEMYNFLVLSFFIWSR